MTVQIHPVGGYGEVGRNMTAIKVDDEVVICDMGIHVSNYIKLTNDEDLQNISLDQLHKAQAIPNDSTINDWKDKVLAIIPTHAHLDHVAAIPFLAGQYKCPVYGTPFTIEVLSANLQNEKIDLPNKLHKVNPNSKIRLSKNIEVEFINITHSTPQTVMLAIHTKYGSIVYANDFKLDYTPTLGQKPNVERLKQIGQGKVLALISECLYANDHIKMPSEAMARDMLREVMYNTDNKDNLIVVTTFSSHIARLKSIIECGNKLGRKILFLGRSMAKYVYAAENANIVNFTKDIELVKYSSKIQKRLKKMGQKERKKYLLVITGHQAEAKATLSKIAYGDIQFKFHPQDHLIFASKVKC